MSNITCIREGGPVLKIGTRDSTLAMCQTNHVRDQLKALHPAISYEVESMKTIGDKILDVALSKIGSKSLFTKELEDALAQKYIHIVVHSLKDMPTSLPEGMVIGAVLRREDPRDAILLHPRYHGTTDLVELPHGAVLGSSSVRRIAQLRRHFPRLQFESVRGNLNTRLNKLLSSDLYAGLVLAAAGVNRMGWKDKVSKYLEPEECMYAVGQGALAVECLSSDGHTLSLLHDLCHADTLLATVAERALMAALAGGCSAPVAVWTKVDASGLTLRGGVWSLDGQEQLIEELSTSFPPTSASATDDGTEIAGNSNGVSVSNGVSTAKNAANATASVSTVASKRAAEELVGIEPPAKLSKACDSVADSMPNVADSHNNPASDSGDRATTIVDLPKDMEPVKSFCGVVPPRHLVAKAAIAHALGEDLAKVLIAKGAGKILSEAKEANNLLPPNLRPNAKTEGAQ